MTVTDDTTAPASTRPRLSATDLALVAAFAALIAACTLVGGIPVGGAGVEVTLQTFAITLTGALLGAVRGTLAVALYLALGAAGLPVFSGHSAGIGVFTGITAGYLWSFLAVAFVTGLLVRYAARGRRTSALIVFLCCLPGVALNHFFGTLGMAVFSDVPFRTAASWDAPFWLGDILKAAVVGLVAAEVHRAFPRLLERR
ncbi:MAG TPA: biotin transporter BioY [Nocardioides sp.]|uniref:biotin transporter BioY n=1 Tax=Nocardioides sp. TaxID=35761 RepID=UPI002C7FE423|nr:biotin transporter BioY [Nocardioides sp.]HTW13472.1 biotin transporter BioY [Nocardioides sp.]